MRRDSEDERHSNHGGSRRGHAVIASPKGGERARSDCLGPADRATAQSHQNFTCGGLSDPSVAVNSAIGLLPVKKDFAHSTVGKVRSAVL